MLLSDDIKLVTVATMLTHVQSFTAVTKYVVLHCRVTNTLTTADEGAGEENETTLPLLGVKMFL